MKWVEPFSTMRGRGWLGRHLLFWLFYIVFFSLLILLRGYSFTDSLKTSLLHLPYTVVLVYLMIYGLIPLLLQGKLKRFLILLVGLWLMDWLYNFLILKLILLPFLIDKPSSITNGIAAYDDVFAVGGFIRNQCVVWTAALLKLVRYWYEKEKANQQLANETLLIELQVMKAQIHPHFLFNTLNNLYSLALKQASTTPDIVQKLSGLLHYMFYECTDSLVPLTKEIAFLKNYIELEKLRYGKRLVVTITVLGDIHNKMIAPLLLIPLLENAFKHGSSQQTGQARIDLMLQVQGDEMTFRLENSTDPVSTQADLVINTTHQPGPGSSGMGLENVRKRLQLIYPDMHSLSIKPDNGHFSVNMILTLSKLSPTRPNSLLSPIID